jgi:hypothetical protein
MPTERTQRRIDAFLNEADAAASDGEWRSVAEKARAVLAMDPENEDAPALLRAAEANLGSTPTPSAAPPEAPIAAHPPSVEQPVSFAGGRYEVRRFLGEGGKKRVFLAHDTSLDRDVAFALIKTEGLDATGRERITREAQAMGRLGTHPHVVTIFEIGDEGGSPYVVNELLAGGDVEGELEAAEGALPLARTLEIATGVCRGLAFAHERGIVHRDLKPGNVWLTEDGVAKIGDFGLAVSLDRSRLTQHGMMVGTVAYMPPEQALGGEVTPQADLYSLGAMLYELVTGRPPFQADDPTAIISQHINTPPVAPSWHSEYCPPDLEALILHLLAKVPADRPASALEVLAALEGVDPEARSASHSDSAANPLDRLARGVFVGRERELERLRGAFDDAFAGRGSVVMLVGEPGIGKTRAVEEVETYARMRHAKVLWGRAHESSGAPPYWPWVLVARAYRDQTPDEVRRAQYEPYAVELQRIFPPLRDLFPGLPEPPADSEEGQFQLFDAFSAFVRSVSVETPLVIVLDDLHWADRATMQLLAYLTRELGRARVLVLGTYRDTDLDRRHPLAQTLAELNREDLFTRVALRGLSLAAVGEYIRGAANVEPAHALVARIHEETEGNPFFLSEVVNLMAEEGTLTAPLAEVRIPEGVREALGRRLDRLSEDSNALLTTLAVAGREFEHRLVRALSGHDDEMTLRLVEEALSARVLEETGVPGQYRFTHALMQETLLDELSAARQVLLHGQIAGALEELYGLEERDQLAAIAEHYRESAVLNPAHAEQAIRATALAAEQSEAANAWEEATALFQATLALADQHGAPADTDLARLHWRLARAARWAMDVPTAVASFHIAFEALSARGDAIALSELAAELARPTLFSPLAISPTLNSRALEALSDAERAARVDLVVQLRLNLLGFTPGSDAGPALVALAELARANDLAGLTAQLNFAQATHASATGHLEEAEALSREAAAGLETEGSLAQASLAWGYAAIYAADVSGLDAAMALRRNARAAGLRSGSANRIDMDGASEAEQHILRAEYSEARVTLPELGKQRIWSFLARARLAELSGDIGGAREALSESISIVLPVLYSVHVGARARQLTASGQAEAARAELDQWEERLREAQEQGVSALIPGRSVAELDDALIEIGSDTQVRKALEILSGQELRGRRLGLWMTLDHMRGRLALRLGRIDEAEQHFRTGLEWCERERCPVEAGRCLQGLAEVAERRGDLDAARERLDAAGELFSQYGAKLYLDQVLAKKEILRA